MSLPVVEIFYSIQGEGEFAGTPSVFLRLGGCNLRCAGFGANGCDSAYAVIKNDSWRFLKAYEILNIIDSLDSQSDADLVITGGEPTLFCDNETLQNVVKGAKQKRICFETNATVNIDFDKNQEYKKCAFSMSVKLQNSGEAYEKRVNKSAIESICKNAYSFFKFVINDAYCEEEIKQIAALAPNVKIFCMPLGATKKELESNAQVVFETCVKNKWSYSDRLHIRIYDDKVGV